MQQWSSLHHIHRVFAICPDVPQNYKLNTCTVTQRLCYYVFTHVLLASIQLILKVIHLKQQYPRSKLKVIYPKPYYYLTTSEPEIHLNYTHKSSSYLALHHKYQLVRVVLEKNHFLFTYIHNIHIICRQNADFLYIRAYGIYS